MNEDDFWLSPPVSCGRMVYAGSLVEPPEFCDEDAVDGEYCSAHGGGYDPFERDTIWED